MHAIAIGLVATTLILAAIIWIICSRRKRPHCKVLHKSWSRIVRSDHYIRVVLEKPDGEILHIDGWASDRKDLVDVNVGDRVVYDLQANRVVRKLQK